MRQKKAAWMGHPAFVLIEGHPAFVEEAVCAFDNTDHVIRMGALGSC
jgi:hypothetical protein